MVSTVVSNRATLSNCGGTEMVLLIFYHVVSTPSPPIKSLDFRGFDPSKLLNLRGGNYHVR